MTGVYVIFAVFAIIGVLLIVLLTAPITYSVNASNNGKTVIIARVSWLLKIVRYTYEFRDGKEKSDFRVLFFKVRRRAKRAASTKKSVPSRSNFSPERKKPRSPTSKNKESPFDKLAEAYAVLTDEQGKIIIKRAVSLLGDLIKILRPRCFDVSGVVGTGCPFNTAMVLGLYESLAGMFDIRKNVRFAGDFNADAPFLKYNASLRGKVSILRVTIPIARFAMHKPVREWLLTLWKDD